MIIPGSEGSVPVGSSIVGLVLVGCRGTGALTFVGSLREGVLYDLKERQQTLRYYSVSMRGIIGRGRSPHHDHH